MKTFQKKSETRYGNKLRISQDIEKNRPSFRVKNFYSKRNDPFTNTLGDSLSSNVNQMNATSATSDFNKFKFENKDKNSKQRHRRNPTDSQVQTGGQNVNKMMNNTGSLFINVLGDHASLKGSHIRQSNIIKTATNKTNKMIHSGFLHANSESVTSSATDRIRMN